MAEETADEYGDIEERIVGLYNVLYEDGLTRDDIEFYDLDEEYYEGEIYLPHIGLNVRQWREWSTEKRIEVLIHEFAHTENYEDDHHPDFWDRVVDLTEIAIAHEADVAAVFDDGFEPTALKRTVVESIHEAVIEPYIDSVDSRKCEVRDALGLPAE